MNGFQHKSSNFSRILPTQAPYTAHHPCPSTSSMHTWLFSHLSLSPPDISSYHQPLFAYRYCLVRSRAFLSWATWPAVCQHKFSVLNMNYLRLSFSSCLLTGSALPWTLFVTADSGNSTMGLAIVGHLGKLAKLNIPGYVAACPSG